MDTKWRHSYRPLSRRSRIRGYPYRMEKAHYIGTSLSLQVGAARYEYRSLFLLTRRKHRQTLAAAVHAQNDGVQIGTQIPEH